MDKRNVTGHRRTGGNARIVTAGELLAEIRSGKNSAAEKGGGYQTK